MNKKSNRLSEAILETSDDMLQVGLFSEKEHEKITKRHLKEMELPKLELMSGQEIKALREHEHLSQAVFATFLNLTVGYISQLERGVKEPSGAVLVLLNVIRRKGIDSVLR